MHNSASLIASGKDATSDEPDGELLVAGGAFPGPIGDHARGHACHVVEWLGAGRCNLAIRTQQKRSHDW
jgi:hypothetical protein